MQQHFPLQTPLACPQPEPSDLEYAGLSLVRPFPFLSALERSLFFGSTEGTSCNWILLVFVGDGCSDCDPAVDSISRFLSDGFGVSGVIRFAEVQVGALLSESEGESAREHIMFISDRSGKFAERAGVVSFPKVLLVSPQGDVVATAGVHFRADQPGFEALSHVLGGRQSEFSSLTLLIFLGMIALVGALILGSSVARRK